ncbi:hypothetical protein XENOCAPTIV_016304 [Xenoophorus captivus]|uniref:Beta-catenin-like protein 1 N-terminal domain-containing protein n=1 Tax=Xenoophorus captivus TaxID=1517983 RepID=A0ABV0QN90_9TELE
MVYLNVFFLLCLQEMVRRGEILDDSMEDEFYFRRLDAGLFVLQLLCYIMVEISNSGVSQQVLLLSLCAIHPPCLIIKYSLKMTPPLAYVACIAVDGVIRHSPASVAFLQSSKRASAAVTTVKVHHCVPILGCSCRNGSWK